MHMFNDPGFKALFTQAQIDIPNISLDEFILMLHGKAAADDIKQSSSERAAAASKLLVKKKSKQLQTLKPREGRFLTYKINTSGEFYYNSDRRMVTNTMTTISLC